MRVGIFLPKHLTHSVRTYVREIVREIKVEASVVYFSREEALPEDANLYWDPRALGGDTPYRKLWFSSKPTVITIHGAAPFTLSPYENCPNLRTVIRSEIRKIKKRWTWFVIRGRCSAIITVSNYAKLEIQESLKIDSHQIYPIYHGVDHTLFQPISGYTVNEPYLLHISSYQPKKNLARILAAHNQLSSSTKVKLLIVAPGYPSNLENKNVELIRESMTHQQLVNLYQRAIGFVFPSLHESFGMPIIEAMACGCPVITSNASACAEVAGGAALLVDPRSTEQINMAMFRLINDMTLRQKLRHKGILHAKAFTWRKSAKSHLSVFENVLRGRYL